MSKNKFKSSKVKNTFKFKTGKYEPIYNIETRSVPYDNKKPVFIFQEYINSEYYTKEDANSDKRSLYNFLNSIKDFSNYNWGDIKKIEQFHAHSIDEDVLNIPELSAISEDVPLFQFKLPNHDCGRFIGYFDSMAIFHIVLYDRNHQIYKRK